MAVTPVKRRLAAILAADAVGYSRLMAADEEGTMRILGAHRAMIDGIIELQGGRIVNTAGDSVLAEFDSPVQAVRCAVEIQDALRTRNDSLPEDKRLVFRIGVNLGDVMVKGDDLLGDGVNVAARLESIATPGGICVSSSVYDQISGKLDLSFVDIGDKTLKNIDRPVRVYRIDRDGRSGTRSARRTSLVARWLMGIAALAALAVGVWHFAVEPMQEAAQRAQIAEAARKAEAAKASEAAKAVEMVKAVDAAKAAEEARVLSAATERQRTEAEQRRAKTEADLARQLAAAITAQRRAEAQASAAADGKRALEAQQAAEGRARAEADVARLRAEAQESKREAAAALSEATAARLAAEAKAAALPAAPAAAVPAIAAAQSLKEGRWTAEISCPPHQGSRPRTITAPVAVADGAFLIEEGLLDQPGSLRLSGGLNSDKSVSFFGSGVGGRRSGSREYRAAFVARPVGARYEGSGRLGPRECDLTLSRAP